MSLSYDGSIFSRLFEESDSVDNNPKNNNDRVKHIDTEETIGMFEAKDEAAGN